MEIIIKHVTLFVLRMHNICSICINYQEGVIFISIVWHHYNSNEVLLDNHNTKQKVQGLKMFDLHKITASMK